MNKKQLVIIGCAVVVLLSLLFLKANESNNLANATQRTVNASLSELQEGINSKYTMLFTFTILGTILLTYISKDKLEKEDQKADVLQETKVVEANRLKTQLNALEILKNEGVLTEEEYSQKRNQIILNTTL